MDTGVGIIFSMVGGALLAAAFFLFRNAWRKARTWKTTTGTVTGYAESMKSGRRYYRPEIRFTAADGTVRVFASSVGSQRKAYRIGAEVKVLYSPDNPEQATIKSISNLCLPGFFALLFGLCFAVLGLSLILK